jgi:hypothetical protein
MPVRVSVAVAVALGSTSAVLADSNGDGGACDAGGFHGSQFCGGGYHRGDLDAGGYPEGLIYPARKQIHFRQSAHGR